VLLVPALSNALQSDATLVDPVSMTFSIHAIDQRKHAFALLMHGAAWGVA
jgi:hypothetical protein